MNREDCREALLLARSDYRYFRRYCHSLLAQFKALRRVPGSIAMIQRRKVLARAALDANRITSEARVS